MISIRYTVSASNISISPCVAFHSFITFFHPEHPVSRMTDYDHLASRLPSLITFNRVHLQCSSLTATKVVTPRSYYGRSRSTDRTMKPLTKKRSQVLVILVSWACSALSHHAVRDELPRRRSPIFSSSIFLLDRVDDHRQQG